jgi:hypothetical protein
MLRFASASSLEQIYTNIDQSDSGKRKKASPSESSDDDEQNNTKNILRKDSNDANNLSEQGSEDEGSDFDNKALATIEEEHDLENLLFGAESSIVKNIDRMSKTRKKSVGKNKNKSQIDVVELAEQLAERKPIWQDPADEEM